MTDLQIEKEFKASARAHANIAVAKYWGKRNSDLNLPLFDSVAFNVEGLYTETTAVWDDDDFRDELIINDWQVPSHVMGRVQRILDSIRKDVGWSKRCVLRSRNNFARSAGLASSASGCAAAALAAASAAGLELSESQLSMLARLGSGSAARSIPAGWTRWYAGSDPDGSDAFAQTIAPPDHWPLHVFVVQISATQKAVSSSEAMMRCEKSPFWQAYLHEASQAADYAQTAILQRDFSALTYAMHHNMMLLHALCMTCDPPVCYVEPKSLELVKRILRACQAVQACCTMDAGANVVVLCEGASYPFVKNDIIALGVPFIQTKIGTGAQRI
ncbi:MAG: diphosphomevalonate decarboxylase [Proteobacteria bacterium]|nr:diphosphomevalonate decarboxylase [Pseudomonadota bacterium]